MLFINSRMMPTPHALQCHIFGVRSSQPADPDDAGGRACDSALGLHLRCDFLFFGRKGRKACEVCVRTWCFWCKVCSRAYTKCIVRSFGLNLAQACSEVASIYGNGGASSAWTLR